MSRVASATAATLAATNAALDNFTDAYGEAAAWLIRFTLEKGSPPHDAQQLVCFAKKWDVSLTYTAACAALAAKPCIHISAHDDSQQIDALRVDVLLEVVADFLPQQLLGRLRCASCGLKAAIDNDDVLSGHLHGWQGVYPTFEESCYCLESSGSIVLRGLRQQRIVDALEQWDRAIRHCVHAQARAKEVGANFRRMQEGLDTDPLSFTKARMYASRRCSNAASALHMAQNAARTLDGLAVDVEREGQWYPARVKATVAHKAYTTIHVEWVDGTIDLDVPSQRVRAPALLMAS